MAKQASIELKNLTKEYVTHEGTGTFLAVDHINVHIGSGEFVTLLGPSGCGKTTTLRMIAGFESVSGGDILLDGIRINEMTPDKRDSSMVFQSYALFPHYDVYDNVAYGLVNKKMDKKNHQGKGHADGGACGTERAGTPYAESAFRGPAAARGSCQGACHGTGCPAL